MKKSELNAHLTAAMSETHDALALLYTSLPPGQQKQIIKREEVRALLERYGGIEEV